jgi:hypothetical protein
MNTAKITGAIGLELLNRLFAGATLTMYSGTQPATPETALSGNTALVTFTYSTPAFGAPTFGSSLMTATATFVAASVSPSNSGTVTFARATLNSIGAWAGTTTYAYGNIVTNSSNYYLCVGHGTSAGSGGPTTTAEGISDNTVTWNYIGATSGQGSTVADYTCGTSGTDIILGSTSINTGVPVDITSFTQSIPVV